MSVVPCVLSHAADSTKRLSVVFAPSGLGPSQSALLLHFHRQSGTDDAT